MNARLRERALRKRPRILAGPGFFIVERLAPSGSDRTRSRSQVRVTNTLPAAVDIAHQWAKESK